MNPLDGRGRRVDHGRVTRWSRAWPRAAVVLGAASLLVTFGYKLYAPDPGNLVGHYLWTGVVVLPLYLVAVWLVQLRPAHPQARLLLLVAFGSTLGVALESLVRGYGPTWVDADWAWLVDLAHQMTGVLTMAASGVMMAGYPDGTVERRWQRWLTHVIWWQLAVPPLLLVTSSALVVSPYLAEAAVPAEAVASPFFVPVLEPVGRLLEPLLVVYAASLLGVGLLLARYALCDAAGRRRMRMLVAWVVLAMPVSVFIAVLDARGVPSDNPWFELAGLALVPILLMIPVSIVVGVLRHQLFDIEVVVRRSVVYAALVLGIALVYVGLAAAPGLALGDTVPVEVAVLLTVAVALLIQPVRRRLEALAGRWVFGERADRYQLITSFGAGLEQTVDLAALLPRLATTVRRGLGADWVRVSVRDETREGWLAEPTGTDGPVTGPPALVGELRHDGELVGRIECGPSPDGYDDADRQLVDTLSRQAATAIANLRLTAHLQEQLAELARSRARIVAAQDEERRRIERDIHDGVQQQVVALIAKLGLARNQLARGEVPESVLAELQSDARELMADLRDLAHGIHPPVLSDGGLVAAVEARTARLTLATAVTADEGLRVRRFDPDVEAAAYFVVCEALTNVVKHARAGAVEVELSATNGHLSLRVRDDGEGTPTVNGSGQGLTNLRDRVEALGGRLRVDSAPGEGTSVRAELPVEVGHG